MCSFSAVPAKAIEDLRGSEKAEQRTGIEVRKGRICESQGQLQMDFDLWHKQTFAVFIFCLRPGSLERRLSDNRWPVQPLYFSLNV